MSYQKVPSHNLEDLYSADPQINSVIRTLLALNGHRYLFSAVADWVVKGNAKEWPESRITDLYRAAKWAALWKST